MRVLWVGPSPLLPTGLGKVSYYLTKGLSALGYDVAVANLQYAGRPIEIEGVRHYPLYETYLLPLIMDDFRPDIVIAYGSHWHPSMSAITDYVVKKPVKFVWYVTVEFSFVSKIFFQPLVGANAVATPSMYAVKLLSHYIPGDKIYYVPHGVNTKIFRPIEPKPRLQGYEDKFVFGAVMRNTLRKEYPVILRAFARLPEEIKKNSILLFHTQPIEVTADKPGWHLPLMIEMFGLEKHVVFTENPYKYFGVSEQDLARIYNAMDVHMLISSGEGFGLPVIESLACGVPNIVSNNTALPEVAGEGACYAECLEDDIATAEGFGVYTTKIESVKECMIRLYEDKKYREKLRVKGMSYVKKFTWGRAILLITKMIDEVVNSGKDERIDKSILQKIRVKP